MTTNQQLHSRKDQIVY